MGRGIKARKAKKPPTKFTEERFKKLVETQSVMNMAITLDILYTHFEFKPEEIQDFIKWYTINIASLSDNTISIQDLVNAVIEETGIDVRKIERWGLDKE